MFQLHPRLEADSVLVGTTGLCQVRFMRNAAWPWALLVPMRKDAQEIHHLQVTDRLLLTEDIATLCKAMEDLHTPDKLNVAAIGNIVPQMHIHVVARRVDDPAWPNPVWGSGISRAYEDGQLAQEVARLRRALHL